MFRALAALAVIGVLGLIGAGSANVSDAQDARGERRVAAGPIVIEIEESEEVQQRGPEFAPPQPGRGRAP